MWGLTRTTYGEKEDNPYTKLIKWKKKNKSQKGPKWRKAPLGIFRDVGKENAYKEI